MTDWPIKTLGDLLEVSIGGIWGNEAGEDEVDVFVYRSTELIKDGQLKEELTVRRSVTARQLDSRKLEEGDLLLEKSGGGPKTPVGRVGLVKVLPGLSVCSNFMQLMRPRKKDVLPVYLHYFLNHFHVAGHTEDLQNNSTNIRNLKTTEYMEVEIPLPTLGEQKRIVALLDAATARVVELTACYEQARTHANNLFASALRGSLESDQSAPLRTLDELCEEGTVKLGRGNIISKKDIAAKPGSYPIYSSARENEGKFGEYGDYMFDEEMITWSIDGGGRLFYRPKHKFSVTNVGGTLRVLDPRLLDIQYLHRVLQNLHSQRVFDWVFKAHPSVIRKVYDAIPMPPLAEQKQVVARLDSMRAKTSEMVAAYDAKLTAAKNLRQSILESAFEGKL